MTRPLVTTIKAYAQLTRASNLPTVMTNALMGAVTGAVALDPVARDVALPWAKIVMVSVAVGLLYTGGMAMNDLVDVAFDRRVRPARPIPSGRVNPLSGWGLVIGSLTVSEALLVLLGLRPAITGLCLIAAIVAYNLLHRDFGASVLLMGLCRGLVILTAAAATAHHALLNTLTLGFASIVTAYTVVLTLIARGENTARPSHTQRWLAMGFPLIPLAGIGIIRPNSWWPSAITAAGAVAWLAYGAAMLWRVPSRPKQTVLAGLAGFCLVDALGLTLLDRPDLAMLAVGCFAISAWAHRSITGT